MQRVRIWRVGGYLLVTFALTWGYNITAQLLLGPEIYVQLPP